MKPDLDDLEAAEKAMSPGPWESGGDRGGYAIRVKGGKAITGWGRVVQTRGDAEGIALLRNSAPALFAELRCLARDNDRLRADGNKCLATIRAFEELTDRLRAASKGGET